MPARFAACLTLVLAALAASAPAQEIRLRPQGAPHAFFRGTADVPKVDSILEASGVEPLGDGRLVLVAHDKVEGLYLVERETGRIVTDRITCPSFPTGLKSGPKWEGMARDDEGNFYVIGSHSGKTDEERAQKAYLFRFRMRIEGDTAAIEPGSVVRWTCAGPLAEALAKEVDDPALRARLKIEGLAIRKLPGRTELVVGLREPGDLVRVFAADISSTPAPDGDLAFAKLFAFSAGSREGVPSTLTSLHYLAAWKGFLVVTATEDAGNIFHGNTLFFVPDASIRDGKADAEHIAEFEPAMKAEGLAELPGATADRANLVITYDNDPHATKIPSRIQTLTLMRRPGR